jgi:putative Mg2+ transporter-C (MgtC) family protein
MSESELLIRLLVAVALGGLIGLERELRDRTAGFRTHILVCVGSAVFTMVSAYGFEAFMTTADASVVRMDPGRIAAQIVTGIGFLGGGAILRYGATVRGLTTAAGLWVVAAVGMAVGVGMYFLSVATTITAVASLYFLHAIENRFIEPRALNRLEILVRFRGRGFGRLAELTDRLEKKHVKINRMGVDPEDEDEHSLRMAIVLPPGVSAADLLRELADLADVEILSS